MGANEEGVRPPTEPALKGGRPDRQRYYEQALKKGLDRPSP